MIDYTFRAPIIRRQIDAENPERYTITAEASDNSLDFYCTHMNTRSLENYAQDAEDGIQLLDSHNARNLGYGRSLAGRLESIPGETPNYDHGTNAELAFTPPAIRQRLLIDSFTIHGIQFGSNSITYASTDDFITAVEAGIATDISIGFGQGNWICDICGGNYRKYSECNHIAGLIYPSGEQGERLLLATVEIDDAHLFESSVVYNGANPNAHIIKARHLTQAREISRDDKAALEARYTIQLPEIPKIYGQPDLRTAPDGQGEDTNMDFIEELRTILELGPDTTESAILDTLRSTLSDLTNLQTAAADGRAYRQALIEEAIAESVRLHGEAFDEETYRQTLETASIEFIINMRDASQARADERLPTGRQIEETPSEPAPQTHVSDAYYTV